jgi:hypothetical protein
MVRQLRARLAWNHPEWWALGLSMAAWIALGVSAFSGAQGGHAHDMWAHAGGASMSTARILRDWMLMVVAMMFPLTIGAVQGTAARSLWRRRHRAIVAWLAGYSAPWLLVGALAVLPVAAHVASTSSALWIAAAFACAALWQSTESRAKALSACHRTWPLAPSGWRATRDCLRAGSVTSASCIIACAPLMVACSLLGHGPLGLATMIGATTLALVERYSPRPDWRLLSASVALPTVIALAFL